LPEGKLNNLRKTKQICWGKAWRIHVVWETLAIVIKKASKNNSYLFA